MSATPPGFIVEFAGLPASGKSRLSRAVAQCLREQGEVVTERTREITIQRFAARCAAKLRLAGRYLRAHPRASLRLLAELPRSGARGMVERASVLLNLLYVQGLLDECARRPGVHLFDQGFFQALWSFSFRGCDQADAIDRLARIASERLGRPPADLVVFLTAPRETIVKRLARRATAPESRLDASVGSAGFAAELEAAEQALAGVRALVERLSAAEPERIRPTTLETGSRALDLASAIRAARS